MTNSTSTSRKLLTATVCLLIFALPTSVLAAVHITKVMYDPPGADQGHEWIELTNTAEAPANLFGFRLFEGGVNHKLSVASGTSTIAAGAKAIIAEDPSQYAADHPAFTGTIFKSSFSLSNTGETIALKDTSLAVVDSYSYTAPLVVKVPPPAKSPKKVAAISKTKSTNSIASDYQPAALPLAQLPHPSSPSVWLYAFSLASLLIVGGGAALYAKPAGARIDSETYPSLEEFNIE